MGFARIPFIQAVGFLAKSTTPAKASIAFWQTVLHRCSLAIKHIARARLLGHPINLFLDSIVIKHRLALLFWQAECGRLFGIKISVLPLALLTTIVLVRRLQHFDSRR